MFDLLLSSSSQGVLWAIMAIGVYLTFRLLDIADLSAEGSFPTGAAVAALLISQDVNPLWATVAALLAGMGVGLVSGFFHTKMHIPSLLTGIITLTGLYSVNLLILGKSNVSLARKTTLITYLQNLGLTKVSAVLLLGGIVVLLVIGLLVALLLSEFGLAFIATGDNPMMSEANGVKVNQMKVFGYVISNGLIALSGALMAQNNGYADLNMGVGTIVIGLAAIILSEVMFKHLSLGMRFLAIVFGSIIYRFIIVIILSLNVDAQMIKLVSALLLALILYIPELRSKLGLNLPKNLRKEQA